MTTSSPRPATTFRVLVRPAGDSHWTLLGSTVTSRTQDEAKRQAARQLEDDPTYRAYIVGDGLDVAVTSARSFKPVRVSVQPQPSKMTVRTLDDATYQSRAHGESAMRLLLVAEQAEVVEVHRDLIGVRLAVPV